MYKNCICEYKDFKDGFKFVNPSKKLLKKLCERASASGDLETLKNLVKDYKVDLDKTKCLLRSVRKNQEKVVDFLISLPVEPVSKINRFLCIKESIKQGNVNIFRKICDKKLYIAKHIFITYFAKYNKIDMMCELMDFFEFNVYDFDYMLKTKKNIDTNIDIYINFMKRIIETVELKIEYFKHVLRIILESNDQYDCNFFPKLKELIQWYYKKILKERLNTDNYKSMLPRYNKKLLLEFSEYMYKTLRKEAVNKIYFWWIPICYDINRESGKRMRLKNYEAYLKML